MDKINITRNGEILTHHTTDSPMSHFGLLVWVVEREDVDPGAVKWCQGDIEPDLYSMGTVGSWLVVRQPNGVLAGIVWSDGTYHANNIVNRETGTPAEEVTLESLRSGKYQVKSTVAVSAWDDDSPLGSVLA